MPDRDLLREYTLNRSETAFSELVARHVNLVFAAARRVVGDEHLARDITQKTFIQLARNPGAVRNGDALAGWLYRVTCNLAVNAVRSERRRHEREHTAMSLADLQSADTAAWSAVAPLLEEALQRLSAPEQDAVLLRFFEGKSLREVGVALDLSDDAAQKRISRALEKMRLYFTRRGVTVSAILLGTLLTAHSAPAAPASLVGSVASSAFAGTALAKGVGLTGVTAKKILALLLVAGLAAAAWLWHRNAATFVRAPLNLVSTATVPATSLRDGPNATMPVTLTLEAPLNASVNGGGSQFILSSTRTVGGLTAVVRGQGTVNPLWDGDPTPDSPPKEYFLEYEISWQILSTQQTAGQEQAVTSKDDFEIRSSAALQPNSPFPLMRVEGKTVTLMTDGKKITLQITKE